MRHYPMGKCRSEYAATAVIHDGLLTRCSYPIGTGDKEVVAADEVVAIKRFSRDPHSGTCAANRRHARSPAYAALLEIYSSVIAEQCRYKKIRRRCQVGPTSRFCLSALLSFFLHSLHFYHSLFSIFPSFHFSILLCAFLPLFLLFIFSITIDTPLWNAFSL